MLLMLRCTASPYIPPPERGRVGVGVCASPLPTPTRRPSAADLPLAGGGIGETTLPNCEIEH